MTINHKKLNIVLGLVIVLIGVYFIFAISNGDEMMDSKKINKDNLQYVPDNNTENDKKFAKERLPDLKYKDDLEVSVALFEKEQFVSWRNLALNSFIERGSNNNFKVGSLTTIYYPKNRVASIAGFIFRNVSDSRPGPNFTGDSIFVTVYYNKPYDLSQSFAINVGKNCEDTCEYNVSDQEAKEIIDLLIEREYPKK